MRPPPKSALDHTNGIEGGLPPAAVVPRLNVVGPSRRCLSRVPRGPSFVSVLENGLLHRPEGDPDERRGETRARGIRTPNSPTRKRTSFPPRTGPRIPPRGSSRPAADEEDCRRSNPNDTGASRSRGSALLATQESVVLDPGRAIEIERARVKEPTQSAKSVRESEGVTYDARPPPRVPNHVIEIAQYHCSEGGAAMSEWTRRSERSGWRWCVVFGPLRGT